MSFYSSDLWRVWHKFGISLHNELNFIISFREERIIDNASSIKYYHNYYLPIIEDTGKVAYFKSGTKCTIVKHMIINFC